MPPRRVLFEDSFGEAAEQFGGYETIDFILDPIVDALYNNPFAFKLIEHNWVRVRYIITNPVGGIPSLCVYFRIDDQGDVFLYDVDAFEEY
jgi:hypothetical protein